MCFELDSEPPIPVIRGAAVAHEDIVLTAADGNDLAAFLAVPERPAAVGIVVLTRNAKHKRTVFSHPRPLGASY